MKRYKMNYWKFYILLYSSLLIYCMLPLWGHKDYIHKHIVPHLHIPEDYHSGLYCYVGVPLELIMQYSRYKDLRDEHRYVLFKHDCAAVKCEENYIPLMVMLYSGLSTIVFYFVFFLVSTLFFRNRYKRLSRSIKIITNIILILLFLFGAIAYFIYSYSVLFGYPIFTSFPISSIDSYNKIQIQSISLSSYYPILYALISILLLWFPSESKNPSVRKMVDDGNVIDGRT